MSATSGKDLVASVEGDIGRLQVVSKNSSVILNDDVREVRQLCSDLEAVLRHQQKERLNFWGERRDYYHYLTEQLSDMKDLEVVSKKILRFPQLTTHQGKGRALLRLCLSDGKLADCIQNAVNNEKLTKEWYSSGAVLRLPSLTSRLLNGLYDLSDLCFDLPCDEVDLNETWPTFQRKHFSSSEKPPPPPEPQSPGGVQAKAQDAVPDTTNRSARRQVSSEKVEHAVEEEPSEIYVKEELTLDIPFAVQVMKEILLCLEQIGPTSLTPDQLTNQILKWEDIPCGLLELRNCIRVWTSGISHQLRTREMRVKDVELQLAETMEQCENDESALAMQVNELETELQRVQHHASDLQKEVTRLSTGNQSLEEELADWRQKVESLENTNFDLQERLVAIGSLVEAVRSEISDYCPSADETLCEVEGKVEEEEEKVEYRIQENLIEGRLQLVMTGCSRITEDLSTLQHERDELQMSLEASFKQPVSIPEPEPSLLQQLTEARKSVGRLQDDNGRLEAEVRELRTLVKSRDAELSATQAHLVAGAAREGPTAASPVELEGEHVELERQLSDAAEELKRVREQLSTLSQLVDKMEKEREELEARFADKEKERKELEARLVGKEKERKELEARFADKEKERKELEARLVGKEKEQKELEARFADKEKERKELEARFADKEKEQKELEARLVDKEKERKELEARLVDKEKEWKELDMFLVEKEKERKELEALLVDKEKEQKELEACLVDKEKSVQQLQRKCSAAQEELQSMQGVVDQEASSFQYEVSSLAMEREQALKSCRALEGEVEQLKGKMADGLQERTGLTEQVKCLQKELSEAQGEVSMLQEQLMDIMAVRDKERAESLKMKNEVDGAEEQSSAEKEDLAAKASNLQVENEELRKVFKALLKQKASLWQHASSLEDHVKSTWQDAKGVVDCSSCKAVFTVLNRKHHCRSCGLVFCKQCCSNRILMAASRDPVRVCIACYGHRNELVRATQLANELEQSLFLGNNDGGGALSDISASLRSYLNPPPSSDTSSLQNGEYSVTPLGDEGTDLVHRDFVDGLPYVVKSVVDEIDVSGEGYCIIETSSEADTGRVQTEEKVASSKQKAEEGGEAVLPSAVPQAQVQGALDLDALCEKLTQLEVATAGDSPSAPCSKGSPSKDTEVQSDEISLRAGQCHEVKMKVDKPGVLLEWEFKSEPKGIAFGMFYCRKESASQTEVLPSRRCTSHKTTLTGKIVAQKPGIYILSFDNSFSKYSACSLKYRITSKSSP